MTRRDKLCLVSFVRVTMFDLSLNEKQPMLSLYLATARSRRLVTNFPRRDRSLFLRTKPKRLHLHWKRPKRTKHNASRQRY